jgi:hypothetical protein
METARGRFEGPVVVAYAAAALALLSLAILLAAGTGEEGVRMGIRATARSSLVLFSLAFAASSLRRLWPTTASAWLLRNRRYLGLSFAVSHALHALGILELALRWPESFAHTPLATRVGGGVGYAFVAAMAATSNDRAVAWLGHRRWRALHLAGSWVLWSIFAASYLPAAARSPRSLPMAILVLAALTLRVAARQGGRRASRPTRGEGQPSEGRELRQGGAMRSRSPSSSSVGQ